MLDKNKHRCYELSKKTLETDLVTDLDESVSEQTSGGADITTDTVNEGSTATTGKGSMTQSWPFPWPPAW